MTPRDKEFHQSLARLRTMIAIKDAQIMSNPLPYLQDMQKRCDEVLRMLEDVEKALSPDAVFTFWDVNVDKNAIPRPIDIQGEALIRCNAALKVLRDYKTNNRR